MARPHTPCDTPLVCLFVWLFVCLLLLPSKTNKLWLCQWTNCDGTSQQTARCKLWFCCGFSLDPPPPKKKKPNKVTVKKLIIVVVAFLYEKANNYSRGGIVQSRVHCKAPHRERGGLGFMSVCVCVCVQDFFLSTFESSSRSFGFSFNMQTSTHAKTNHNGGENNNHA